jgi:hypothetical protein
MRIVFFTASVFLMMSSALAQSCHVVFDGRVVLQKPLSESYIQRLASFLKNAAHLRINRGGGYYPADYRILDSGDLVDNHLYIRGGTREAYLVALANDLKTEPMQLLLNLNKAETSSRNYSWRNLNLVYDYKSFEELLQTQLKVASSLDELTEALSRYEVLDHRDIWEPMLNILARLKASLDLHKTMKSGHGHAYFSDLTQVAQGISENRMWKAKYLIERSMTGLKGTIKRIETRLNK